MEEVRDLFLRIPRVKKEWQTFLTQMGINDFGANEILAISEVIGIFVDGKLIATGSLAGNVLKYIAASDEAGNSASLFNRIVSELINRLRQRGIFHAFVFTKPQYVKSFEHVGFVTLAQSTNGAVLEVGKPAIQDYLAQISKPKSSDKQIAAIVMNANPFTLGHRYLVEKAARESDLVYIFVVSENQALFSSQERLDLVRAGTHDLKNVVVLAGGDYMVSFATFPAYFIKSPDQVIDYQTTLDARIFGNWIGPSLGITKRYLGSEPLSHTTNIYNQVLQRELAGRIDVEIVDRKRQSDGNVYSARMVRQMIAEQNLEATKLLVPPSTYSFIKEHQAVLSERIKKGQKIDGN